MSVEEILRYAQNDIFVIIVTGSVEEILRYAQNDISPLVILRILPPMSS